MKKGQQLRGFVLAAVGSIGWGISGVCSQYLFAQYDLGSDWLTAVRMLLSGLMLLIIASARDGRRAFRIWKSGRDILWLLAFALLGLLLCQYTFLGAIKHSNSATATVLQSLNVVIMALVMAVRNRKRMSLRQCIAVILAVAGTFLTATNGSLSSMSFSAAGLVLGVLAAVGVVTYTLLSRPIIPEYGNLTVTGWGMLIGGLVLACITRAWHFPAGLDAAAWVLIAVIVLVGTAVGFSLFLESVRYIGPVKATLVGCLEPASATVLSAVFLGTRFTPVELIGFVLILLTVFLSVSSGE